MHLLCMRGVHSHSLCLTSDVMCAARGGIVVGFHEDAAGLRQDHSQPATAHAAAHGQPLLLALCNRTCRGSVPRCSVSQGKIVVQTSYWHVRRAASQIQQPVRTAMPDACMQTCVPALAITIWFCLYPWADSRHCDSMHTQHLPTCQLFAPSLSTCVRWALILPAAAVLVAAVVSWPACIRSGGFCGDHLSWSLPS